MEGPVRIAVTSRSLFDGGAETLHFSGTGTLRPTAAGWDLPYIAACRENGWSVRFYPAEQLRAVPGTFTGSEFVSSVTGVDNVCERAACLGAQKLLVQKTALDGVTVAVAEEAWEVQFE